MNYSFQFDPEAQPQPEPVVYEQPLNERMRNFLRLEFLYTQATYHSETLSPWSLRAAVSSLLEILAITARSDARSDLLKELERQAQLLREFQTKPGVDAGRLRSLIGNITRLRADLTKVGANFMAPLRDSEFLSAIKHRSAIPGGTCDFDLPEYSFWLNHSQDQRTNEFEHWLNIIRPLCDGIIELLWLTRENSRPRDETAQKGVFQLQFDREHPCQLVRVTLDPSVNLFPEISGNQHRCTIRFLRWRDAEHLPSHIDTDTKFVLTCCA